MAATVAAVSGDPGLADDLRAIAGQLADEVAHAVLDVRRRRTVEVDTKSTATDLVTEIDRWAETRIVERLTDARPADGIVGEEGARIEGTSGVDWYVDPIDGTTNYVYGHPGFSVSIAAALGDEVIAGAVADPVAGELYTASANGGATCNGASISTSARAELSTALLATGFGYRPERRRRQAEVLVQILPEVRDIRRMGGAAVDLCSVGRGRVDAYYEVGLSPWDCAAGSLIAREAGATVTDRNGTLSYLRAEVVAPAGLHGPLLELLQRAGGFDV